jgi:hypothetical protein
MQRTEPRIGCGRDINATQAKTASDCVVNVLIEMKAYHFLSLAANLRARGPGPVAALSCSTNSSASFTCWSISSLLSQ